MAAFVASGECLGCRVGLLFLRRKGVVCRMGKAVLRPATRLNPNWWLYRLPIILGCFLRFQSIFRLVVGILLVLFS